MRVRPAGTAIMLAVTAALAVTALAQRPRRHAPRAPARPAACGTAGLSLPPGFCATVFAEGIGHARHMAVAGDGIVYVNTWSGNYYKTPPPPGGFLVALKDGDGDGRAEQIERFGPTPAEKAIGGTGIALYKGALFAEQGSEILRLPLAPGRLSPTGAATVVVSGLPLEGDHQMHGLVIDKAGQLFVNSGSISNACEKPNRQVGAKGVSPCPELATHAGLWRFDANRPGQRFSPAERYATGIRNSGAQAIDAAGQLFATQHGRDQLGQNWPALYTQAQGAELPAEELLRVERGADYGWPTCYYDPGLGRRVLAPEYGGDGRSAGACAGKAGPAATFPAHWAPTGLLFYPGGGFPRAYAGGAFVAFHGSWNRAPSPQAGFNVVFQPMQGGRAAGPWRLFADGFRGRTGNEHRPAGLAVAPDGALYVSDDVTGRIWRITYRGAAGAPLAAAKPAPTSVPAIPRADALTPPPGFTRAQLDLGRQIYEGKAKGGTCFGCHGDLGQGASVGPALVTNSWLWADGSVESLARVITTGVAKPIEHQGAMPALGGAPLTTADVRAVSAYIWALNHPR